MNKVNLMFRSYGHYCKELYDIEVPGGLKTVALDCTDSFKVNLGNSRKVFPDVEKIIIGEKCMDSACIIPNRMFPNLQMVESNSQRYLSGVPYLVSISYSNRIKLLNTFCKKAEETIDLKGIHSIGKHAFSGCMSTNVINTKDINVIEDEAFLDSALKNSVSEENPLGIAGDIVFEIHDSVTSLEVPPSLRVFPNALYGKKFERFSVNKFSKIGTIPNTCIIKSLIINDKGFINPEEFINSIPSCVNSVSFTDDNPYYKTTNRIIYSKDGKILFCCPKGHMSPEIEEGTEIIARYAFCGCKAKAVHIPDSVKYIGDNAFYNSWIESIDLGNGLNEIGTSCFEYCLYLSSVEIPENIKTIGNCAFRNSPMEKLVLHEGLETIKAGAFQGCGIMNVEIPASCKTIEPNNFDGCENIKIKGNTKNIIEAFTNIYSYDNKDKAYVFRMYFMGTEYLMTTDLACKQRTLLNDIFNYEFHLSKEEVERIIIEGVSNNTALKQDMTIQMYIDNPENEDLKTLIRRGASSIMKRYILNEDFKKLSKLLSLGIVTKPTLENALKLAEKNEKTVMSSYIVDAINKTEGKKTFRL